MPADGKSAGLDKRHQPFCKRGQEMSQSCMALYPFPVRGTVRRKIVVPFHISGEQLGAPVVKKWCVMMNNGYAAAAFTFQPGSCPLYKQ
jgi:hypothetical protein